MSYVSSGMSPDEQGRHELDKLRTLRELARAQEFADERAHVRNRRAERFMCAVVGLIGGTCLGLLHLFS